MSEASGGKKSAVVILNGISLKKKIFYHEYLPGISEMFDVEVHETLSQNDAKTIASRFTARYVDVIFAAGGDGTLNQVVNGILRGRETEAKLPVVGVIPIGSGNDFARGAGLRTNPGHILRLFREFNPRPVDVGVIHYAREARSDSEHGTSYFVNVADIGMGPHVVGRLLSSGRPFGSEVAYYKSILNTFLTYKPMVVRATSDEWSWEGKVRTFAVANGKYYGNGLCIAPDAEVDDRIYSVFICGNVSVFDFIMHTGTLKKGKNVNKEEVLYKTATSIEFTSQEPCPIEGDGEILGYLPAKVGMIEKQLHFLI